MSKARDLNEYSYNDDDIERLHKLIKNIMDEYFEILYKYVNNLSNEEIKELADYFLYFTRKYGKGVDSRYVSINKMKAFFLLFNKLSDDENADRILSYLESMEMGWHGGKYYLSNACLRRCLYSSEEYCKRISRISYTELASKELGSVADIFFYDEFSPITLFVFNYCLASLYSSLLNIGASCIIQI